MMNTEAGAAWTHGVGESHTNEEMLRHNRGARNNHPPHLYRLKHTLGSGTKHRYRPNHLIMPPSLYMSIAYDFDIHQSM